MNIYDELKFAYALRCLIFENGNATLSSELSFRQLLLNKDLIPGNI